MDHRRKRATDDDPPTAKRCKANEEDEEDKQEDEECVPDKQLRERNKALRGALAEKNRRLAFLESKCHELFAHRHAFDGRFQLILNHWSSFLNTLHVLMPDPSRNVENDLKAIAEMEINIPPGIKCEIDEWFQAGTEPAVVEQPGDAALDGKLHEQCDYLKAYVNRLLETTSDATKVDTNEALARAIEEKTSALRTLHATKDELNTYKRQVQELKRDLDRKEVERHQVCREFERLKQGHSGAALPTTPKADGKQPTLDANTEAASPTVDSKETLEKLKQLENDLRKATAAESVIRHSMESTKALADEQYARLYNENINLKEEYSRFKLKCKDMESHIHDKWKKKFAKFQADSHKMKSKIDELAVKNAELRSRIVTYTSYKEQMKEYKDLMASYERQVSSLQEQLKGTEMYRRYVIDAKDNFESSTVKALQSQLEALQKSHEALQNDIKNDELKELAQRENSLRSELADVQNKLVDTETALDSMTRQLELRKHAMVNHEAELNAIVGEVDAVNREMETLRTQMKKTLAKLNDKENAMAKLAQTNIKLEQANAVSFDELAGVRLQVAALQGLQKQHKALEQGFNDVMKQKENELLGLQAHLNDVLKLKDDAEKEKIRILREFHYYQKITKVPTEPEKPETPPPCEKCQEREAAEQEKPKEGTKEMTELERFELNDLRKKLRCSVCQDAVKDVIISKCSHMFCKECMDNNLKARNRKCPTCKKMFGQDDLKSVWWTSFLDLMCWRLIAVLVCALCSCSFAEDNALLAQPTWEISVPWEHHEPKWKQCYLCWKSVHYINATHALGNVPKDALAKGTHLTCSWLAHRRNSPTCRQLTESVPAIVANLSAGHQIHEVCHSLHLCKKRKPKMAEPPAMKRRKSCLRCVWTVKYVNATTYIAGLPEKAVEIGVETTCPSHCPRFRKQCNALVHAVPSILKAVKAKERCPWKICKKLNLCKQRYEEESDQEEYDADGDENEEMTDEEADEGLIDHHHRQKHCNRCSHRRQHLDDDEDILDDDADSVDEPRHWDEGSNEHHRCHYHPCHHPKPHRHHHCHYRNHHCHHHKRRHHHHHCPHNHHDHGYDFGEYDDNHGNDHAPEYTSHHHHHHHYHYHDHPQKQQWPQAPNDHVRFEAKPCCMKKLVSFLAASVVTMGLMIVTYKVFKRSRQSSADADYVAVPRQE